MHEKGSIQSTAEDITALTSISAQACLGSREVLEARASALARASPRHRALDKATWSWFILDAAWSADSSSAHLRFGETMAEAILAKTSDRSPIHPRV